MIEHYIYRFIKSSWGIYIDLSAQTLPLRHFRGNTYEIAYNLFLSFEGELSIDPDDATYIPRGFRLIYNEIQPLLKEVGPLVVQITQIETAPVDYQPEGLAYAIAGWMIQHFNLDYKLCDAYFDRENNRYVFHLPPPEEHDGAFY